MKRKQRFYKLTDLDENENIAFNKRLKELVLQYSRNNNTLKLDYLIPILGNCPVIPDSPDTDARLEAFEDRVTYTKKANAIIAFLECYANVY